MLKLKYLLIAAIAALLLSISYYQYSISQIPEKVARAQAANFNVDTLRFTFKVSILAQKSLNHYVEAVSTNNEDQLYDAIDFMDASIAFSDMGYINDPIFKQEASKLLLEASKIIQDNQLSPSKQDVQRLYELVDAISNLAENKERLTWRDIQANYLDFSTQEYKLRQTYETISIIASIFLLILLWLTLKQRNLMRVNKKNQGQLKDMAYFDSLTKIANRKNIENSVDTKIKLCQRKDLSFYLALIDIDNFKKVNDLLGHDAGDELLQKCVEIFHHSIRQEDLIGRLGGDEFLIIFNEHTSQEEFITVLSRLELAFEKPLNIHGVDFQVTISTGISNYPKDMNGTTKNFAQHLIKSADIAMYHAKSLGKNQISFYNQDLEDRIQVEHKMEVELKRAILNEEFELYYQPQINASNGKLESVEALVRWNHPERGLVMPNDFIGFIEKGMHTVAFGEWVTTKAIQQQKKWYQNGIELDISINLSVKHILSPMFYQKFTNLINLLDANLNHLAFEITEYELISSDNNGLTELERLKNAGFHFHLDDFGTGYSSISYLNQLPINTIKIDKSFVDYIKPGCHKKLLVKAIIALSKSLDKKIIAEGVENRYQADFLKAAGCETFQGYYYAKPLQVQDLEEFYKTNLETVSSSSTS